MKLLGVIDRGVAVIENNEQRDARWANTPTAVGQGGSFGLKAEPRRYRCGNCGDERMLTTNHTSTCLSECGGMLVEA